MIPEALIFDMDGLMIDSEGLYWKATRDIAAEYGKTVKDQTLWRMMGRSPLESVEILLEETGIPEQAADMLHRREEVVFDLFQKQITPMPGLGEILDYALSKFDLAIATSAPDRFAKVVVDRLNLSKYFKVIQTSAGIKKGKPDPEIYLKAMAKLKRIPQACIVLEDSSNGLQAGKRAGAYVIAVPTPYTKDQDLSFANFHARDLHEARAYIETLRINSK